MSLRISTAMMQTLAAQQMVRQQSELVKVQQQLSTGRRILTPADDPVGTTRAASLANSQAMLERLMANQKAAHNQIGLAEQTIGNAQDVLQTMRERIVQAGDASLGPSDLRSIATDLRAMKGELLAQANARDATGGYLFSGFAQGTQPFAEAASGATYNGDQGVRMLQVGESRTMALSESGAEVFERIRRGNGVFQTDPAAGNTGTGVIDRGAVADTTALTDHVYSVNFTVTGTITTYAVVDTTAGTTLSTGNAYTSGSAITVAGMQFAISGAPANGDSFTARPSANQGVFTTIANAINALERGQGTPADRARFSNDIASALADVDQALDHLGVVRGRFGIGLQELDDLQVASDDRGIAYAAELSDVRDVDYAKTISEYLSRQQALQAAQESYARIAQRSLFDVI